MEKDLHLLSQVLPPWYQKNKRDLPWRHDHLPYHIWISEIMLQQTRVEAVKDYYIRFLRELPDIESLAHCEDDRLHKLWEGLGYYNRVRNLRKAAQMILSDFDGVFPQDYQEILSLPGIGPYTAGAISSISFGQPRAAVDGNVLRVITRLSQNFDPIDLPQVKLEIQQKLEEIYPRENPGIFTQALMELGATICVPNGAPKCEICPCSAFCQGKLHWQELPVKLPKRKRKQENRTVFVFSCGDEFAIQKRPDSGLLAGLWQFPNCSDFLTPEEAVRFAEEQNLHPRDLLMEKNKHHIFTHIRWDMRCFYISVNNKIPEYLWLTLKQMDEEFALPTAFRQFRDDII